MQLDVTLCRFSYVMPRVHTVTVRDVGVMSRRLVFAGAMMSSCEFYCEYRQPANSGKRVEISMFLSRNETGAAIAAYHWIICFRLLRCRRLFFRTKPIRRKVARLDDTAVIYDFTSLVSTRIACSSGSTSRPPRQA